MLLAVGLALLALAVGLWRAQSPAPPPGPPGLSDEGAGAGLLPVPSGQQIAFLDRTGEPEGVLRFRFLAPGIGEGTLGEQASEDMQALCDLYALAHLPDPADPPRQIVISLSERAVPLGESAPDVVQFFEAYRIESGACVWEMF